MAGGKGRWLAGAAGIAGLAGLAAACGVGGGQQAAAAPASRPATGACDTAGLSLPPGFCATVFADGLGHARQMAVRGDGAVYVNIQSGRGAGGAGGGADGGYLVALKDSDGDGRADKVVHFGPTDAGGTGVRLYKGWIYAETGDKIVRYPLPANALTPTGPAETVVSGLPLTGDHPMHPFAIDARGMMLVDVASATNSCQSPNRRAGVPGAQPCTELNTRAGIWRYDANTLNQAFSPAARYATGIRNGEGIAFDASGRTFATQHGRDQLKENWGSLYPDAARTLELPSEELVELKAGGDYGWPYCYFDNFQHKLVLGPEYGGDGGKAVGVCAQKTGPVAAFPAHWGPNDLLIYGGQQLPRAYRGGAFIAFHGSWNRAPAPQGGFNVVFQPMRDGRASGEWVVFADGFAGPGKASGRAEHRPTGLAMGPDGALYISDDSKGRIWRVTYRGPASAPVTAAAAQPADARPSTPVQVQAGPMPLPPGSSAAEVAAGARVYASSTCAGCHGPDGAGSAIGPSLVSGAWMWGGSLPQITATIRNGVPQPKQYRSPMPPMGGAALSDTDLKSVSAYVWSIGRGKG